ncbi:MAG: DUF4345 family protein [Anaerolineales bacterium]|jgi:hypothetical protein|nr:DUF4345 family protein [Anaerolineales bacterium]
MLEILKLIGALLTIATGGLALFSPKSVPGFTGLQPVGGRGITEIRSIFGGLFIGLGLYPIVAASPAGYAMLGWAYLAIAVARLVSIFLDKSATQSNWVSLGVEVVLGLILVL